MKIAKSAGKIDKFGWMSGLGLFAFEGIIYKGTELLSALIGTGGNAWCPKIPAIDDKIGLAPIFVLIYVFSFFFWICGPAVASLTGIRNHHNYMIGLAISYIIGGIVFTFFPTHMDRVAEGLMDVYDRKDFFSWILSIVYFFDGKEIATSLFPSFHCVSSVYCYLGIRKQPEITKGFKVYTFIMAVLICLSTLFVKQHYFLDVVSGILLPIIVYLVVEKINPGKRIEENSKR